MLQLLPFNSNCEMCQASNMAAISFGGASHCPNSSSQIMAANFGENVMDFEDSGRAGRRGAVSLNGPPPQGLLGGPCVSQISHYTPDHQMTIMNDLSAQFNNMQMHTGRQVSQFDIQTTSCDNRLKTYSNNSMHFWPPQTSSQSSVNENNNFINNPTLHWNNIVQEQQANQK